MWIFQSFPFFDLAPYKYSLLHSNPATNFSKPPILLYHKPKQIQTTKRKLPKCPATTPISSCAGNSPASQSAESATNATENVQSATPTCARQPSSASATSAPSATTRTSASCAVGRGLVTRSIALSVRGWRRIGMGVRRLLIWGVRGRICFIRRRVFGIIEGFLTFVGVQVVVVEEGLLS